jgi:hypothetical protein
MGDCLISHTTTAILPLPPQFLPIGSLGSHFILDCSSLAEVALVAYPLLSWRNSLLAALRLVPDLTVSHWPHYLASHLLFHLSGGLLNVLLFGRFITSVLSQLCYTGSSWHAYWVYLRCLQLAELVLWFGCGLAFIASVLRHDLDLVQALLLMARGAL